MLKSDEKYLIWGMYDLVNDMGNWYLCEVLCQCLCEIDPDDLIGKNNLACALNGQGKYAEAEALYRQCWELMKKTLGEHHQDTLNSINNIAVALDNQGKCA
eukprot:113382-Ditylum_brightwellii.AAC.1